MSDDAETRSTTRKAASGLAGTAGAAGGAASLRGGDQADDGPALAAPDPALGAGDGVLGLPSTPTAPAPVPGGAHLGDEVEVGRDLHIDVDRTDDLELTGEDPGLVAAPDLVDPVADGLGGQDGLDDSGGDSLLASDDLEGGDDLDLDDPDFDDGADLA
ncbi:MAG TPA: hypothetical protein VGA69_04235 [Nitriliruptorales bacterium]